MDDMGLTSPLGLNCTAGGILERHLSIPRT